MLALLLGLSVSSFALAAEDKKRISRPGAKPVHSTVPSKPPKPLAAKAEVDSYPQQQFVHPAIDGLVEEAKAAPVSGQLRNNEFQVGTKQDQLKPALDFHFPASKPRTSLLDDAEHTPRQAEIVDYAAVEKAYLDAAPKSPNPPKKGDAKNLSKDQQDNVARQNEIAQYEWWLRQQQQARAGNVGVDGDRCLCGTYVPSFHCMQSRSNPLTAAGFQSATPRHAGTIIQNALAR